MRLILSVLVAAVIRLEAQSPITTTDADVIIEALRVTAVQDIARRAKPPAPEAALAVVNQSVAVCGATSPKTFCLDSVLRTLDVLRQRGNWPMASLVTALRERNKASASLAHLQLATGSVVPRAERGGARRSVAQVSLPAIEGDDALIVVAAQYAGTQIWAVQLRRSAGAWKAVRVEHLMSGG
jgi:hypothetical protein